MSRAVGIPAVRGGEDVNHLDTHLLVWLYLLRLDPLSPRARALVADGGLAVSPIAVLELTYLKEVGRLTVDGPTIVASLQDQLGLRIDDTPFPAVVGEAHTQRWTRDPFDRLIVAQALVAGAALVTADSLMRENVPAAVW